ncbi:MAG: hypothetical protein ACM3N0_05805 [Chloroflexota bacterium]
MPTTTTITRAQRAGIYELVRNHLAGIGDVVIALEETGDYAAAERLGLEFAEDVDLLADIGWRPDEERESFDLTMPVHDLAELLNRLHDEAERVLAGSQDERRSREEDEASEALLLAGLDACEKLLVDLDERGGDSE